MISTATGTSFGGPTLAVVHCKNLAKPAQCLPKTCTFQSPHWWQAYNKVKHHRDSHFHGASLKNALNALAGLFVLLLFFYRIEGQEGGLSPDPSIFRIGHPFIVDRPMWGPDVNLYLLDENAI